MNCGVEMLEARQLLSTVAGFSNFTLNKATANPAGVPAISADSNTLTLTTGAANEISSAVYNTPVSYQNFTASFTYTSTKGTTTAEADGVAFMLENASTGVNAIGGGGGNIGYSGITPSFSAQLNVYQGSSIAVSNNGVVQFPAYTNTGSVNLASGDGINVSLVYNSTNNTLSETLTDATTNATYTTTYNNVDIPVDVGNSTAYVGFTGSTGGSNALQAISNFSFSTSTTPPPVPPAPPAPPPPLPPTNSVSTFTGFTLNGANSLQIDGSAPQDNNNGAVPTVSTDSNTLTLTTAAAEEASSAFYDAPVGYQNFSASFTYTETPNSNGTTKPADGFAFTLQNDPRGVNALGGGGGDLGYGTDTSHTGEPISPSFAAEFNMYEVSSVSVSTDGVPTISTTTANTGAVNLISGDPIAVTLNYNSVSQSLTETLTDSIANTTYTTTFNNINLVNVLGSATALVGFAGGTGGSNAGQTISNFAYSASPASLPPATSAAGFGQLNLNAANGAGINGSSTNDNNPGGVPAVSTDNKTLTLTTAAANEASSAFSDAALYYNNFSANFTYTDVGGAADNGGITFSLEDDPRGQTAIGAGGANLGTGSDGSATLVSPSLSVQFEAGSGSIAANGVTTSTGSVNLTSGDPINVNIVYNATANTLTATLTDATANTTFSNVFSNVNLAQLFDNPTAYVGFTGGTTNGLVQTVSNYTYNASIAPQVSLGGYAETYGIQVDGTADLDNGYDGGKTALSYTFFGSTASQTAQTYTSLSPGQTFFIMPANGPDAVTAMGQTIAVPQGNYANISLLGDGVNGAQPNQTIQLNYTNGTFATVSQGFSDWFTPKNYLNENSAFTMNYRLSSTGAQENVGATIHVYEYNIPVNPALTLQSITLPINKNVKVLAMNLNTAPVVAAVSPNSGPTAGGTSVTITGSGFTGATAVDFGSTPASSFTINNDGSITAVDPAGSGTVDVTVVGPYGTSPTTAADQFTYGSGTPITITGVVVNGDNPNGLYTAAGAANGKQRSMVEDIVYTFSAPVSIANANQAFTMALAGSVGTLPSTLSAVSVPGSNGTQWAVILTGKAEGTLASIANGEYSITINPQYVVSAADGTTPIGSGRTDTFYRLFGEINGDQVVNAADNFQLKTALSTYNPAFDSNGDGVVNAADNFQFKASQSISFVGFTPTI